jgi:hypothetical protein
VQKKHLSKINVFKSIIGVKLSDRVKNSKERCIVKENEVTKIEKNMFR